MALFHFVSLFSSTRDKNEEEQMAGKGKLIHAAPEQNSWLRKYTNARWVKSNAVSKVRHEFSRDHPGILMVQVSFRHHPGTFRIIQEHSGTFRTIQDHQRSYRIIKDHLETI